MKKRPVDLAIEKDYDYVICGHIHQPEIKEIVTPKGTITYLNSGDWVENLSALEFHRGEWTIYRYQEHTYPVSQKQASSAIDIFPEEIEEQTFAEMQDIRKLLEVLRAE